MSDHDHPNQRQSLVEHSHFTSAIDVVHQAAEASGTPLRAPPPGVRAQPMVVQPWGSPMQEPVPRTDPAPRPDNDNAWGRSEKITGPDSTFGPELARVVLPALSESLTVSIDADPATPPGFVVVTGNVVVPLTVWAQITIGSGSTSVKYKCRVDSHLDVPVTGTYIAVQVYLATLDGSRTLPGDLEPGSELPTVQVYVQVSRAVRGLPSRATRFVSQAGNSFSLSDMPCRLSSIAAHLSAAGAEAFLQLFDITGRSPNVGEVPVAEWALGTTPEGSAIGDVLTYLNTFGLSAGAFVVVSSASGAYALSAQQMWVAAEFVEL